MLLDDVVDALSSIFLSMRSLICPLKSVNFDGLYFPFDVQSGHLHDSVRGSTSSGSSSENRVGHLVVVEGSRKGWRCCTIFFSWSL